MLEKTRSNACWTRLPDSELRHHLKGEASRRSVPGNQPESIATDPTTAVINNSPSTNCISKSSHLAQMIYIASTPTFSPVSLSLSSTQLLQLLR